MKYIKIYESFLDQDASSVAGGSIPVFDDMEFSKSGGKPEEFIPIKRVVRYVSDLLERKDQGEFESVNVVAMMPYSGKRTPKWVRDMIYQEKKKLVMRRLREAGSKVVNPAPSDIEREPFRGELSIDSEYEVVGIEGDMLVTYPISVYNEIFENEMPPVTDAMAEEGDKIDPKEYYRTLIHPENVEEIHYT
jgi:hypothetical protein